MTTSRSTLRLAWVVLAPALLGAGPGPSSPADPIFTALKVDATSASGRLARLTPEGAVVLTGSDGAEQVLPVRELFKLTRADEAVGPAEPEGGVVVFPGGDRLYRTSIGAAKETTLQVHSFALGPLSVPIESLVGLVLAAPTEAEAFDALLARVRIEPRTSEVLWLVNGDKVTGGLLGLDERKIAFKGEPGQVDLDRSAVLALGFDPALADYPEPEGAYWELTLLDGSRVGVSGLSLDQGQLGGLTRFGAAVKVPLAEVARMHARHPRVVDLTSRDPAAARYVPYLAPVRPFRTDRAVDGGSLTLSGRSYDRGIGSQSRTLLAYRIEPGDRRFQALVGVDDRAGPLGSVTFRVRVDNRVAFDSKPMSAGDRPVAVDVDLAGGKVLILETDFGERGDVRDLADWVEARLIR